MIYLFSSPRQLELFLISFVSQLLVGGLIYPSLTLENKFLLLKYFLAENCVRKKLNQLNMNENECSEAWKRKFVFVFNWAWGGCPILQKNQPLMIR